MKTIVTHISVDLDAVAAVWLIRRFFPGWSGADFAFVSAGKTKDGAPPDSDPETLHVDTGLGIFDHHQDRNRSSATERVFLFATENGYISDRMSKPLERLVGQITDTDNFGEAEYPDPTADRYDLCLHQTVKSMAYMLNDDVKVTETLLPVLDAVLQTFIAKERAEKDIEEGYLFTSKWGESIAMDTSNEEALKLALKRGFGLTMRRDPKKKFVRIKSQPKNRFDLAGLYEKLNREDPGASWYYHPSGRMIINGPATNPESVPTKLPLSRIIAIAGKI